MKNSPVPNLKAVLLALLVTFLWSTSFIIIKWGLADIPPLTYAGLRYFIAFLALLPFALKKKNLERMRSLTKGELKKLFLLGILFYSLTQGTQFVGLSLLPAVTVSLLLNFTPVIVAVMAVFMISEIPTGSQRLGILLFVVGIVTYFYPVELAGSELLGLAVMFAGVIANALSAVLGRDINRDGKISPIIVTVISMGVGSVILLAAGIIFQGLPPLSFINIIYLLWLAVINTAFAFTLWNLTLRSLTAIESSIINGTMLIQIAVLAWFFLGESISAREFAGMLIAGSGAVLVQLKLKRGKES